MIIQFKKSDDMEKQEKEIDKIDDLKNQIDILDNQIMINKKGLKALDETEQSTDYYYKEKIRELYDCISRATDKDELNTLNKNIEKKML